MTTVLKKKSLKKKNRVDRIKRIDRIKKKKLEEILQEILQ